MSETAHIAAAAAALGDEYARDIEACIDILKTEPDLARRRAAEKRFLRLTEPEKRRTA